MKRCVMTVVSDPFVFGAIVMIKSFLNHNPYFDDPIVILWNRENAPLSEHMKAMMNNEIENLEFREVENEHYGNVFRFAEEVAKTPKRLRAAFYILEALRSPYDYVVTLDSDMLVMGDLSVLFERTEPFSVVRAFDAKRGRYLPYFNTGTMVIRRDVAGVVEFEHLADALDVSEIDKSQGRADQAVLNIALRDTPKYWLGERYNYSKRLVESAGQPAWSYLQKKDVRILHFLGEKPWNVKVKESERNYIGLEEIWWQHAFRFLARSTLRKLVRAYIRQTSVLQTATTKRLSKNKLSRKDESAIEASFIEKVF
ncbi:hypothetical protein HFP57_17515 [Parasphingopyxis algicola]|uniref:glycosyltransferase n=1 Tax=Parasphingopyxis algicola TaxID=2026624 RepID=UPI0015A33238|nr:glycosyltransferase [Parasphingopyxis algicola]QLC26656.1 hypothetical protein HFP57_17515 [Parasphingopyxis algicola]